MEVTKGDSEERIRTGCGGGGAPPLQVVAMIPPSQVGMRANMGRTEFSEQPEIKIFLGEWTIILLCGPTIQTLIATFPYKGYSHKEIAVKINMLRKT